MRRQARGVLASLLVAAAACDQAPTTPSGVTLTGTWAGMIGASMSMTAVRVTWVATQDGADVSGTGTLVKPAVDILVSGTLAGRVDGSQITLTLTVPLGSVPGVAACSVSGNGSGVVSGNAIAGTFTLTAAPACQAVGVVSISNGPLNLTKV